MKMIPHIFTNPFETRCRQNGRIRQGLLVFAFLMVLFNLAGIPLVLAGGMYGNALDEIIVFLIGSILVVRALHIPLKEVFPLKKPDGAGILGTILMWYVTYRGCADTGHL